MQQKPRRQIKQHNIYIQVLIVTLNHPLSPKKQQKTGSKISATMVVPYEKKPNKTNQPTTKKNPKPKKKTKNPNPTQPCTRGFCFRLYVTCLGTSFQQNVSTCYELCKLMHTINTLNYSRYHNTMHTTMANQRILPQSV